MEHQIKDPAASNGVSKLPAMVQPGALLLYGGGLADSFIPIRPTGFAVSRILPQSAVFPQTGIRAIGVRKPGKAHIFLVYQPVQFPMVKKQDFLYLFLLPHREENSKLRPAVPALWAPVLVEPAGVHPGRNLGFFPHRD